MQGREVNGEAVVRIRNAPGGHEIGTRKLPREPCSLVPCSVLHVRCDAAHMSIKAEGLTRITVGCSVIDASIRIVRPAGGDETRIDVLQPAGRRLRIES